MVTIKDQARNKVLHAIKQGRLIRPRICSECSNECVPQAHHSNYKKPLMVNWLCQDCHTNLHYPIRKIVQGQEAYAQIEEEFENA